MEFDFISLFFISLFLSPSFSPSGSPFFMHVTDHLQPYCRHLQTLLNWFLFWPQLVSLFLILIIR